MTLQVRVEVSRTSTVASRPWPVDIFGWDEPVKYHLPIRHRPIGIRRESFGTFAEAIEEAFGVVEGGGWVWA